MECNYVSARAKKGSVIKIGLFFHDDAIRAINTFVKFQDFDLSVAPIATIGQEIEPKIGWCQHMMPCLIRSATSIKMVEIPYTVNTGEIVSYALGRLNDATEVWAYPDGFTGEFEICGDCYHCGKDPVSLHLK